MTSGHSSARLALFPAGTAPSLARRHIRTVLGGWRLPAETVDIAELLVSELVTNAVTHASGDVGVPVVLEVEREGTGLRITVSDGSPFPPVVRDTAGPTARASAEGGRGLGIVAALSKEWGHRALVGGGKTVWCEVSVG